MAKAFVVADVHSFYDELIEALNLAGFDANDNSHIFVSLGDLLDRGPKSVECLNFVNSLPAHRKILIRGNHEDLMEEVIQRGHFASHDFHNGTVRTVYDVVGSDIYTDPEAILAMAHNPAWLQYISSCINYYETGKHIFVHGWIPVNYTEREGYECISELYRPKKKVYNPDWRTPVWNQDWFDARWLNGMATWADGIVEPHKTIYCGHWHTSWGHTYLHHKGKEWSDVYNESSGVCMSPFIDKGIVAMDGCVAFSHQINCRVIGNFPAIKKEESI